MWSRLVKAFCIGFVSSFPVTTTMGADLFQDDARIRRVSSKPSSFGICRSTTMPSTLSIDHDRRLFAVTYGTRTSALSEIRTSCTIPALADRLLLSFTISTFRSPGLFSFSSLCTLPGRLSNRGITFVLIPLITEIEFAFAIDQYGRCHGRKDFGCR